MLEHGSVDNEVSQQAAGSSDPLFKPFLDQVTKADSMTDEQKVGCINAMGFEEDLVTTALQAEKMEDVVHVLNTDLRTLFDVWSSHPDVEEKYPVNTKERDLIDAVNAGRFDLRSTWIGQKWGESSEE